MAGEGQGSQGWSTFGSQQTGFGQEPGSQEVGCLASGFLVDITFI